MANEQVYQMVTDRMLQLIDSGVIPWRMPWMRRGGKCRDGMAYSRGTGKPYSLLNQLLLGKAGEWLTFKQAQDAGGKVRKGEKARFVVFWKFLEKEEEGKNGEKQIKQIPLLRYFNVFHIDQCEGVTARVFKDGASNVMFEHDPIVEAEAVMQKYVQREGITFKVGGDRAYYSPMADLIAVPARDQFPDVVEYYSAAFHEATHSTGHSSRLNRLTGVASMGSGEYSREELTAEMGSAFLCGALGINTEASDMNSAAYLQNWGNAIRADHKAFVTAAGKAEKAVQMIAPELFPKMEAEKV